MNFYEQLHLLKTKVHQGLELKASVQSIVEEHLFEMKSLLRNRSSKNAGPFTLKQLAEHLEIGYFALRTSIKRAESKAKITGLKQFNSQERGKSNHFVLEPKRIESFSDVTTSSDDLKIVKMKHIQIGDLQIMRSGEAFFLDKEDGSDLHKMVLREEIDNALKFGAYPREGRASISRTMTFNQHSMSFD